MRPVCAHGSAEQIRAALRSSGADERKVEVFARALGSRIAALGELAVLT